MRAIKEVDSKIKQLTSTEDSDASSSLYLSLPNSTEADDIISHVPLEEQDKAVDSSRNLSHSRRAALELGRTVALPSDKEEEKPT